MTNMIAVSGVCYGVAALFLVVFGVIYMVRSQFMPYHRQAAGIDWHMLDARLQMLLLALMRVAGGGMFSIGVSIILLLFPFFAGNTYPRYIIPVMGLITGIVTLYVTFIVRKKTGAATPVATSFFCVGLFIGGLVFSLMK